MRLPVGLPRGPRHVEVAPRGHGHVLARDVGARDVGERALVVGRAADARRHGPVERRVDRLLHRGGPGVRGVVGHVDRALVGRHLGLAGLGPGQRLDQHGRARELGRERDALPVGAAVGGVQQDGGLAHQRRRNFLRVAIQADCQKHQQANEEGQGN